jgi:hypothetical protein
LQNRSLTIAGMAVLVFLLPGVWPGPAGAAQPRAIVLPNRSGRLQNAARPGVASPRRRLTGAPAGCTANNATSFDGISTTIGDIAGGYGSGVASGQSNEACDQDTGIGTGDDNLVSGGSSYNSFIAGGNTNYITGENSFIGAGENLSSTGGASFSGSGYMNANSGPYAFLGAGYGNSVSGYASVVGGGYQNSASGYAAVVGGGGYEYWYEQGRSPGEPIGTSASGTDAFVGAGDLNSASGYGSFVGGGGYTYAATGARTFGNQAEGQDSFVGAGDQNVVVGAEAAIVSGGDNTINEGAPYSSILGGNRNSVSGEYASVLGGFGNAAIGSYSIVAGGDQDTAGGTLSFAAGYHADAVHSGSFVWSDYSSGSATIKDTAVNQFVARASGGVYLYSNEGATVGVKLAAGSGTWASLSDRNAKTAIVPLDDSAILAKVAALPIAAWQYKSERGVRHLGPMAQDFYAAFGVGEDDRHITSIDEDGVALAAVKALNAQNARLNGENADLRARLAIVSNRESRDVAKMRFEIDVLKAAITRR